MIDGRKIFINGKILPADIATVSVFDRGFLYGDGVFETMRGYGGNLFCLDEHLNRLRRSAALIKLNIPWSDKWLKDALEQVLAANGGANDLMMRLTVTRGLAGGGIGVSASGSPTIVIAPWEVAQVREADFKHGWTAVVSKVRRNNRDALDPSAKTINFLNNILAKIDAEERGADEAIMLNSVGLIAEGSVSNVFIIKDGRLRTPPETDGLLAGITRGKVIEIARATGIETEELSLAPQSAFNADEAFLTLSSRGIIPLIKIDDIIIGEGVAGQITTALAGAFNQLAAGKLGR